MVRKSVVVLVFVQVVGAIFYCVLLAAYVLPFPSMQVLIGEPVFRSLLSVFGGLFLVSTLVSMIAFGVSKRRERANGQVQ
ncbi:MAG TPA: hypothetical protein ENN36_06195 [Candidatus Bathyarchaeota archaeon]|nr:hypothetical protein [Candidatus Bathyarchaeota archaeon]